MENKEGSKFGWGVLGFFLPIVGFILFLVWIKDNKNAAAASGIGALIGFVTGLLLTVVSMIVFFSILGGDLGRLFGETVEIDEYRPIPISEVEDEFDDSCTASITKMNDGTINISKTIAEEYGYKVILDRDCDKSKVYDDSNYLLFFILKEKNNEYKDDTSYKFYVKFPDGEKYQLSLGSSVEKIANLTFYKIGDNIVFDDFGPGANQRKIYIYNFEANESFKVELEEDDNMPWYITNIDVDENDNVVVSTSIYTSSGFEGLRDDPRVKVLMEVLNDEITYIDETLETYGASDFPFRKTQTYSKDEDGNYLEEPKIETTTTIKEYFNER